MFYSPYVQYAPGDLWVQPSPYLAMGPMRYHPTHYASAGAVPTTGVPLSTAPAGEVEFDTHILVVGARPVINVPGFQARLAQTVNDADLRMSTAPVTVSNIAVAVAPTRDYVTEVGNAIVVATRSMPIRAETLGTSAPRSWVTISGRFTATQEWNLAGLNRAIQRALMQNLSWSEVDPAYSTKLPGTNDGLSDRSLYATLTMANACTGGADWSKVFARACTRWAPLGAAASPGPATPVTQPTAKSSAWKWILGAGAVGTGLYFATRMK